MTCSQLFTGFRYDHWHCCTVIEISMNRHNFFFVAVKTIDSSQNVVTLDNLQSNNDYSVWVTSLSAYGRTGSGKSQTFSTRSSASSASSSVSQMMILLCVIAAAIGVAVLVAAVMKLRCDLDYNCYWWICHRAVDNHRKPFVCLRFLSWSDLIAAVNTISWQWIYHESLLDVPVSYHSFTSQHQPTTSDRGQAYVTSLVWTPSAWIFWELTYGFLLCICVPVMAVYNWGVLPVLSHCLVSFILIRCVS